MKIFLLPLLILSTFGIAQTAEFDWANSIGNANTNNASTVAINAEGEIYMIGLYVGTLDIDPGAGQFHVSSVGSNDVYITKLDANGNFLWGRSVGGSGNDRPTDCELDNNGDLIITGSFSDTADFDPGSENYNLTSNGTVDVFILKLDSEGNFIWAKSFGGIIAELVLDVHIDENNNVFTTGSFHDTVDFDTGAGTFNLISEGGEDVYIHKLSASGVFEMALCFGSGSSDRGQSITTDALGNIFTFGTFQGTIDIDPGVQDSLITSNALTDIFIQKLDAAGNLIWANGMGGSFNENAVAVTVNEDSEVFLAGRFSNTVDFDPSGNDVILTSNGIRDIFLQKLSANGDFEWVKQIGSANGAENLASFKMDNSGNIYLGGSFNNSVDFNPGNGDFIQTSSGSADLFLEKLNIDGDFIWAISIGGQNTETFKSLAISSYGKMVVVGNFQGPTDFDPGNGTSILTAVGSYDAFVVKLNQATFVKLNEIGNSQRKDIMVYPNPFNSQATVSFNNSEEATYTLIAYNSLGQKVMENNTITGSQFTINKSNSLANGLYHFILINQMNPLNRLVFKAVVD